MDSDLSGSDWRNWGIGTILYWRQNKLGSTSDALSKAFDALEKSDKFS